MKNYALSNFLNNYLTKKVKIIQTVVLSVFILTSSLLSATHESAGTTGFAFLKISYSARAMGMANAFTALSNDGDAVFFNPAGLRNNANIHVKASFINYLEDMKGGSIVYSTRYQELSIAPFFQFLVSDDIQQTKVVNGQFIDHLGTFQTSHIIIGTGFAKYINESLDLGFNIKYFYEKLFENHTSTAIVTDLSLMHQPYIEELKIGATLKNLGYQLSYYTEAKYKEKMPLMLVLGASHKIKDKGFINLDVCKPFDNDFYGKIGCEYAMINHLTLRTGVDTRFSDYQTNQSLDFLSGISFGIGLNWDKFILDYGISSMGSFDLISQISISYLF